MSSRYSLIARIVLKLSRMSLLNWISDRMFLRLAYKTIFNKKLNLKNPITFNEKLQYLKLNDRNPTYTVLVDKYLVKKHVRDIIGNEYIIPTLGVWENAEQIDFDNLPPQFVLKCNHNSGGLVICKDKGTIEKENVIKKLNKDLKRNGYWYGREWPYKNVKARIIAEKYMEDLETKELRDYKFFCFNGKVKCFKVDFDRFVQHGANYYTPNGELMPFGEAICPPNVNKKIDLPTNLSEMVTLAERLSKDIPFVRVDFYNVDQQIYFGEMTFYPASGFRKFVPEDWDNILGDWLTIPNILIEK